MHDRTNPPPKASPGPLHRASGTVLVTGSSSGLGRACVERFVAANWNVVASMRAPRRKPAAGSTRQVLVVRLDVTDEMSITSAVEKGIEKFGGIDVVVNNAGFGLRGIFEAIPKQDIQRQFDVNLFGAMNVCRAILPHLREKRAGVIVNVSSASGAVGLPLSSIYAASKFGLEGFSEALAFELLSQNIVVKLVEPGGMAGTRFIATSNRESARVQMVPDYASFAVRAESAFANMAGRKMNSAAHVANVIFNAATDGSDQLRYVATDDIRPLLKLRREASEAEFIASMRRRFPHRE